MTFKRFLLFLSALTYRNTCIKCKTPPLFVNKVYFPLLLLVCHVLDLLLQAGGLLSYEFGLHDITVYQREHERRETLDVTQCVSAFSSVLLPHILTSLPQ